jgi:DNA polymerase I-like protein with 3'-5' exonuclease and polymerase domains
MFMVLDVETTFKEVNGKTDPSPFVEGNKLVSIGLQKFRTDINPVEYYKFSHESGDESEKSHKIINSYLKETKLLIGHNIKFDLQWLLECGFAYDGAVYDTMVVEYLMAGGIKCDLTLDGCCRRREIKRPEKDLVSDYMNKGIDFHSIPWGIVKKYGIADIEATKSLSDYQVGLLKTSYKEFL